MFAADAVARMTGVPGVAAVTAGPGLTNTLTAVENALLAQTPLIVIGGATATILRGRGALQDIDQVALMKPAVKACFAIQRVRRIGPMLEEAFRVAQEGVPGPVFVEIPVDLLYPEAFVREWYIKEAGSGAGLVGLLTRAFVEQHLFRVFRGSAGFEPSPRHLPDPMIPDDRDVAAAAQLLAGAVKPVIVVGAQTITRAWEADEVADALRTLGIPVWLGGTARGLLGADCDHQYRHARGKALKEADVVIVCGFPFDFRLGYGQKIPASTRIVQVNREKAALTKNRRPTVAVHADAGRFLVELARRVGAPWPGRWADWLEVCRRREDARDAEIAEEAAQPTAHVNPLALCRAIEARLSDDSVLVVDGGDFVATAAYICKPRSPLSWLDPGVYGTLGVGGGFAVGASAVRRGAEIWLFYGDGSSAYSLAEFDTLARHGLSVIAVIGNDASWAQIARDQTKVLGSDVATVLAHTAYHQVAEGYGGKGLLLDDPADIDAVLDEAKAIARSGKPVCINAWIGSTGFREGSISI